MHKLCTCTETSHLIKGWIYRCRFKLMQLITSSLISYCIKLLGLLLTIYRNMLSIQGHRKPGETRRRSVTNLISVLFYRGVEAFEYWYLLERKSAKITLMTLCCHLYIGDSHMTSILQWHSVKTIYDAMSYVFINKLLFFLMHGTCDMIHV